MEDKKNKPGSHLFSKEKYADPAFRKVIEKRVATKAIRKRADPWKSTKFGYPCGTERAAVIPLWRAAHTLADKYLEHMKKTDQAPSTTDVKVIERAGILPHTEMVIPENDEEKAAVVLREAFLMAIGPTNVPDKIKAINTVLAYTRAKPESTSKVRIERAEDFLDLIAEVNGNKRVDHDDDAEAD